MTGVAHHYLSVTRRHNVPHEPAGYAVIGLPGTAGHRCWLARHLPTALVSEDETGGHLPQDIEAEIASTFA